VVLITDWHTVAVNCECEIVEDGLRGREVELELDGLFFVACVTKAVDAGEVDCVSAVPEQPFLAVLQIEIDVNLAALEGQRRDLVFADPPDNLDTVFDGRLLCRGGYFVRGSRRRLGLLCAPGRFDAVRGDNAGIVCPREESCTEDGPSHGCEEEDERDGDDSFGHSWRIVGLERPVGNVVSHRKQPRITRIDPCYPWLSAS